MGYQVQTATQPDGLADVLERILDKGIVIAGDISVSLVGIELLTIRLRLLIATVDKAREMGIDWWERDAGLTGAPPAELVAQNDELKARIEVLERQLGALPAAIASELAAIQSNSALRRE